MKRYCDLAVKVYDVAFIVTNPSCEETEKRAIVLDWDDIRLPGNDVDLTLLLKDAVLVEISDKIRDAFEM